MRGQNQPDRKIDAKLILLERREMQLWWLAVFVIVLLGCAVSSFDWTSTLVTSRNDPLSLALNTRFMRVALIVSVLAISAYFRDTARRLRRTNSELITDLHVRTDALQRKNDEVSKLKDLSDHLLTVMDLDRALNLTLDVVVEVIQADSASIMLREEDSDVLYVAAWRGMPDDVARRARVRVGDALAGMVAESGKAIILNSDDMDAMFKERAHRTSELASAIIAPIHVDSQVRGVINVSKRRGGSCFSDEDLRVLSAIVNQTAMVIMKIDLWEDLQDQVVKLREALAELKQTQGELVQSEKLAGIGRLAGGIAHEINNPLQVILGRVELLLDSVPEGSSEARQLGTIMEHVKRISEIVSSLLRFARRQPDEKQEDVSVDEAVTDAVRLLGMQLDVDDVQLELSLNCDGITVQGSRVKLQQVFMNLIVNAYQAMRGSGGALRIVSEARGGDVVVSMSDTGPGIPREHLSHIFEPFFTTKQEGEGTGLGLFVTYGIVESHGGRMDVESEPGGGTTFTVVLPSGQAVSEAA